MEKQAEHFGVYPAAIRKEIMDVLSITMNERMSLSPRRAL